MGEDWKSWKDRLLRDFIRRDNTKSPCDVFNISEEEWAEFRRQKDSEAFKVKNVLIISNNLLIANKFICNGLLTEEERERERGAKAQHPSAQTRIGRVQRTKRGQQ